MENPRNFKTADEPFIYTRKELAEKLSHIEKRGRMVEVDMKPEDIEEIYEITNALDHETKALITYDENYDVNKRMYIIKFSDDIKMSKLIAINGVLEDENGYYIPYCTEYMG